MNALCDPEANSCDEFFPDELLKNGDFLLNDDIDFLLNSEEFSIPDQAQPPPSFQNSVVDFINDLEMHTSSVERNTPSPSNSSNSSSTSNNDFFPFPILDTPPISPENYSPYLVSQSPPYLVNNLPAEPIAITPTPVRILQGTLIPVQSILFNPNKANRPARLKPKPLVPAQNKIAPATPVSPPAPQKTSVTTSAVPVAVNNNLNNKNSTLSLNGKNPNQKQRTIVLTAKDYNAFIKNCKINGGDKNVKRIIIKTVQKSSVPPIKGEPLSTNIMLPGKVEALAKNVVLPQKSETLLNNLTEKPVKMETEFTLPRATETNKIAPKTINKHFEISDRGLKKRQRMIKNRESASISRLKKKEYVSSLESKCNELHKENMFLKSENANLRSQLLNIPQCECKRNSNLTNPKSLMNGSSRKNTAVLLAMVFMVSLNFGTFNSLFTSPPPVLQYDPSSISNHKDTHFGRGLLWIGDNMTSPGIVDNITAPITERPKYSKCPLPVNQTENMRIATELKRWIGSNKNLTLGPIEEDDFSLKFMPDYLASVETFYKETRNVRNYSKRRKAGIEKEAVYPRNKKLSVLNKHPVQVFSAGRKSPDKYAELFEEIKRRDDTFYVLSFNTDNILLPAAAYNKSNRPRVSFMLPAGGSMLNGKITLMQIDCEVLNTSMINLKEKYIPDHLRTNQKYNVPRKNETRGNRSFNYQRKMNVVDLSMGDYDKKENDDLNKMYKPYFIDKTLSRSANIAKPKSLLP